MSCSQSQIQVPTSNFYAFYQSLVGVFPSIDNDAWRKCRFLVLFIIKFITAWNGCILEVDLLLFGVVNLNQCFSLHSKLHTARVDNFRGKASFFKKLSCAQRELYILSFKSHHRSPTDCFLGFQIMEEVNVVSIDVIILYSTSFNQQLKI